MSMAPVFILRNVDPKVGAIWRSETTDSRRVVVALQIKTTDTTKHAHLSATEN